MNNSGSITQGEQVSAVWKPLYERFHIEINFAYQTFRWNSESKQKAAVHCVIIGFHDEQTHGKKKLFTNEHKFDFVDTINPYLLNAPTVFIDSRKRPLANIPAIVKGSSPVDGQNLLLSEEEYREVVEKDPGLAAFIHPFLGAKEFLHKQKRYCLWLINQNPSELKKRFVVK